MTSPALSESPPIERQAYAFCRLIVDDLGIPLDRFIAGSHHPMRGPIAGLRHLDDLLLPFRRLLDIAPERIESLRDRIGLCARCEPKSFRPCPRAAAA